MKKYIIILIVVSLICVSMSYPILSLQVEKNLAVNQVTDNNIELIKENYFSLKNIKQTNSKGFGVWIHTEFDGQEDSQQMEIDLITFKLMLESGGWRYYYVDFGTVQATTGIAFSRTSIYVDEDNEYVDVVQTQFSFETNGDTNEDYEVSLEVRFPFSAINTAKSKSFDFIGEKITRILNFINNLFERLNNKFLISIFSNNNIKPIPTMQEDYFCVSIGFASPEGDEGPHRVETRFFFGRNSIFDPRVFRMKITPHDLGGEYELSYFNSYSTVNSAGSEVFYRFFSVDFDPAAELQITSIPRKAKIGYAFGSSSGVATKISFRAEGGALSNIIQSFLIDPLPSYMTFDLTILGERSFEYRSDHQYSVTYMMDSVQEGNLVKVELDDMPRTVTASWGLKVLLGSMTVSGGINLDMSSDITRAAVSLYDSATPFIEILNFPQQLDVSAYLDIPNLIGRVSAIKSSPSTMTINVPIRWDKWEIIGSLYIHNGFGSASFDLPDSSSNHVSVGLDTNGNSLFGLGLSVYDTDAQKEVLYVSVEAIATDDFSVYFDYNAPDIENFGITGRITELVDLVLSVDYFGADIDLSGSWNIGEHGSFDIRANKELLIDLSQLDLGSFKIDGSIGIEKDGRISIEWDRGQTGYFMISTEGVSFNPEVELSFIDANSNEIFINGRFVLNPRCIVKFDWEWGQTGHFTVFTNNIIDELFINVGYNYNPSYNEYQYGFKITAEDVNIIRTIQWDTQDGHIPRFWVLGDNPLPGNWDVWLLWNYEWYEVK